MRLINALNSRIIYYLCLMIFFNFLLGCHKEPKEVVEIFNAGNMFYGTMTALKNGTQWMASMDAQRGKDTTFGIQAGTVAIIYGDTLHQERISVNKIRYRKGIYEVLPYSAQTVSENQVRSGYTRLDHDAVIEYFAIDVLAKTNFFEVTVLDSLHVEGKMDITVIGDRTQKKYRFSNGHFTSKFIK